MLRIVFVIVLLLLHSAGTQAQGQEPLDKKWSSLEIALSSLKTWGTKNYSSSTTHPGPEPRVVDIGSFAMSTEIIGDLVILRDRSQGVIRGKKISLDVTHICRKDNFLSPARFECNSAGTDQLVNFVAIVANGKAKIRASDGREDTREFPEGTITLHAMMRLVTLVPRTPGNAYSYDFSFESADTSLKRQYRLLVLQPEQLIVGERQVECSKMKLTGGGINPIYYWVTMDGVLQRVAADDNRNIIELKDTPSGQIDEFQPNVSEGGRANTIAVHPTNNDIIFVTSESGGLFRSIDRGKTWKHVDSIPCFATMSVAFVPSNPDILLVTTKDDYKTKSGGGIWRSTDGGFSWTQAALTPPNDMRPEAYDISIAPDRGTVYVGWPYGLLTSTDQGATWTASDPYPAGGAQEVTSLSALSGNRLIVGGPAGVRFYDGSVWKSPTNSSSIGGLLSMGIHSLSNALGSKVFVFNSAGQIYFTKNGGQDWTQIPKPPLSSGGCGGIPFVRARISSTDPQSSLNLYFGDQCKVYKLNCPFDNITGNYDFSGLWKELIVDHPDTRDIAFTSSGVPLLLATDGGLHQTSDDGANWTFVGGGFAGFNALQINEVKGQIITDINSHDLYYATHDNNLYSSGDGGTTWQKGDSWEGYFIEMERRVPTANDWTFTYVTVYGPAPSNRISKRLFSQIEIWNNPPGHNPLDPLLKSHPKILGKSFHIQGTNTIATFQFQKGLVYTSDLGRNWQQFATFSAEPQDLPKTSFYPFTSSHIIYQPIRVGYDSSLNFEINKLARIQCPNIPGPATTVTYPAMTNFGGLGMNYTWDTAYQVFAVDPFAPWHLIAPDVVNSRMMESQNWGDNWTELAQLTQLVTDGGNFRFSRGRDKEPTVTKGIFPIVTAVSFCPDVPNLILVGTSEGGIYVSSDGGTNWAPLKGSEKITKITSFYWKSANEVIVSSYGRGLWFLSGVTTSHNNELIPLDLRSTPPNEVVHLAPPPPPPHMSTPPHKFIVVWNGEIHGGITEMGILKELFVSPGSSVIYSAESEQFGSIKITETAKAIGFKGLEEAPVSQRNFDVMKGIHLGKDNQFLGVVFGDKQLRFDPTNAAVEKDGDRKSPIEGKPYLRFHSSPSNSGSAYGMNELMHLSCTGWKEGVADFSADVPLEVLVDGNVVSTWKDGKEVGERIQADAQGTIQFQIRFPVQVGIHTVMLRTQDQKKTVLDGAMFFVKHRDEERKEMLKGTETPKPK
ncbi:MAG: hypothetical protein ABL888_05365 [Pirellulaceae bacterium]